MHQLGILAAAVHYYKKVLDIKPLLECEGFSCEKEAAFNLSLIYKNSGSMELARMVLKKHIVTWKICVLYLRGVTTNKWEYYKNMMGCEQVYPIRFIENFKYL